MHLTSSHTQPQTPTASQRWLLFIMDEEQVRARLQAIEEERRQLQREQEEEGGASASAAAAAAAATTATSSTRRQLWALAMEMAQEQQEQQQQQPEGQGDEDAEEELSTLRESVRLLEAVTAVAALPAPASLTGAAGAAGPLVLRLPSLVEQHLAACGHLEALLQAEQRARRSSSNSGGGGSSTSTSSGGGGMSSSQQQQQLLLLGALLRLVRGQGRALRERILWAVHNQALSFPFPQQEGATPAVAACVHRRPRRSGGTTSGLLPLFLALKRLQTHAAANPLPLNVTEDPLQRRRVGSPKSPRGGASSLGPPPSQLDRLLSGIAHALVDRAVAPAVLGRALGLVTGTEESGDGEVVSLSLGPAAGQAAHPSAPLAASLAAAEAVAGFVCDAVLDGEPWWAEGEDEGRRPLLAPLVGPVVEALGEGLANGLLQERPQDDEAARALLRPLLQQQHPGQGRSLALQRFLDRVIARALAGPVGGGMAAAGGAAAALLSQAAGPFNVRETHARALALEKSQELLAGLVHQQQQQKQKPQQRAEAEAAALAAWRELLREACAAPSPAVAPPAVLACIPREIAALVVALGNAHTAAARGEGPSPGRRGTGQEDESLLSPALRKGLAEALLAFGHRQGRWQQQLQGGVGGRDWSTVDIALKLRPER